MAEKITRPAEPYETGSKVLADHMDEHNYSVKLRDGTAETVHSSLVYSPHTPYLPEKVAS